MALSLLDTNVLVHAMYLDSPLHRAAAHLVALGLRERGRFCIAPQNLVEFAAVVTQARFVDPPLSPRDVSRISKLLYRSRRLTKIYPKRGTVLRTIREGSALRITGAVWYDLFLALTMRDAGVRVIITEDVGDFGKFPFVLARRLADTAPA
jgi:predicted nucleic acid-binding protein